MSNKGIVQTLRILGSISLILWISSCSNTFHGMKQDIREDTDSDDTQTVVVKKTTVETTYPSDEPTSPPPLQTPPQ